MEKCTEGSQIPIPLWFKPSKKRLFQQRAGACEIVFGASECKTGDEWHSVLLTKTHIYGLRGCLHTSRRQQSAHATEWNDERRQRQLRQTRVGRTLCGAIPLEVLNSLGAGSDDGYAVPCRRWGGEDRFFSWTCVCRGATSTAPEKKSESLLCTLGFSGKFSKLLWHFGILFLVKGKNVPYRNVLLSLGNQNSF